MKDYILDLDRPRKLKFGFKAIRLIREHFKGEKDLTDVADINIDELPVFVWAGLVWEDKSLTLEMVDDLLEETIPDRYRVLDIVGIALNAIAAQIGVRPGKKKQKKTPTRTTVGSRTK